MAETVLVAKPTRFHALLPNITAGLVFGVTEVVFGISLASLIFSGPLQVYLHRGIAVVLISSAVNMIFMSVFASLEGTLSGIQDDPAVLMAVAVSALVASITVKSQLLPSVITLIFVTTFMVGGFMLLLGHFRLGGLMRYIPYPVIGGFLAGTGWLLARGAIGVAAGYELSAENLPHFFQSDQLISWIPAVILGLALFWGTRRIHHYLVMPGILVGALVIFYLLLVVGGISIADATRRGLLMGDIGGQAVWQPLPVADLMNANWSAVFGQGSNIGTIVLLSTIILLLNISGMELEVQGDVDLNHELRVAGVNNILTSLAGGMIGFQDLSYSTLLHRMGARGRMTGVIIGLICLLTLFFGTSLLAYIPRPMLGGLLLFLGLNFLYEWIVEGYQQLGRVDYAVVLLILGIIAATNFITGVSVGLVVMIIIFVVKYSRINIFHHILSGSETASRVERNAYHQRELVKLGKHVYVLELEGFIFFGTANAVLNQVRSRADNPDEKPLLYLLLDFRRVTGLDSSAMFSLIKVKHLADARNFTLIFTHLADSMQAELMRSGLPADEKVVFHSDLDHGLEWCEEKLLEISQITRTHMPINLQVQLGDLGFAFENTHKLKSYLEQIQLFPGDYLIHQGETRSDLYFIEIGQVSVYLELDNGEKVRVQTPSMGTILGELSFYLDVPRSASVIADFNTVAYRLTRTAMEEMKAKDPELAIAFNEMMVRVIAERLVANNRELVALNR